MNALEVYGAIGLVICGFVVLRLIQKQRFNLSGRYLLVICKECGVDGYVNLENVYLTWTNDHLCQVCSRRTAALALKDPRKFEGPEQKGGKN